jgi:hypothetical protein
MTKLKIKQFNTTGVCIPSDHYMLPVLPRIQDIDKMFSGNFYFVIHAPRQSGKTTFLNFQTEKINSEGKYYAINCSLSIVRNIEDENKAMTSIFDQINQSLYSSTIEELKRHADTYDSLLNINSPGRKVRLLLNRLCEDLDKPLIVFFDEADCLSGQPLITFLSQIRDAYMIRHITGNKFPSSIALVGVRDIRDYLVQVRGDSTSLGTASPFNIKKYAFTLANFTKDEIRTLYHQHTEASGQAFQTEAIERAWYWTEGQPWLVNAIAYEVVTNILNNDHNVPITANLIDQAANILINRRDTHIDFLLQRLKEPRVAKVMDSVFASTISNIPTSSDDRRYCIDLGLVVPNEKTLLRPANAIYKEVLGRIITDDIQDAFLKTIPELPWTDGKVIYMTNLLKEFQSFWRKGSLSFPFHTSTYAAVNYDEALYSFILLAFFQRLVNSKATVVRQFAEGRGAVDIGILYQNREYIIEAKIKDNQSIDKSINQICAYLDSNGENEGWLVIFDRDREKTWEEKIYWKTEGIDGKTIHIVGC